MAAAGGVIRFPFDRRVDITGLPTFKWLAADPVDGRDVARARYLGT
jgi:hypothetical protein